MVIDVGRKRRMRADCTGRTWPVGSYRRNDIASRRYRCFLNGSEVTHQTFYCDTRRGIVRMFLVDADGRPTMTPVGDEVATVERRGHVQLRRRK